MTRSSGGPPPTADQEAHLPSVGRRFRAREHEHEAGPSGDVLAPAVAERDVAGTQKRAIQAARAALDLQLRHRPVVAIEMDRFSLWVRQLQVDAGTQNSGAVSGDVVVLEWVRDRFAHALAGVDSNELNRLLGELEQAADREDFTSVARLAENLQPFVTRITDAARSSG